MTTRLLEILVSIGSKYQADKVDLLAKRLASIDDLDDFPIVASSLRNWMKREDLNLLESACKEEANISTSECIAALKASNMTRAMSIGEKVEPVWTGPSTPLVSTRRTEQVLLETIEAAREKLFIVSYVAYDVDSIVASLSSAIDRGVKLEILMESTSDYGGRINMDSIALFQREIPDAILYWWNEPGASVHAKCAVADGKIAFVTSANLTGAAMEKNMELGIKIEGGDVPKRLHEHLEALVTTGKITKVE
jgi:phosphatidylserine/phosphatidylglycerophosphate/cardiolipin synthase-like enzyme